MKNDQTRKAKNRVIHICLLCTVHYTHVSLSDELKVTSTTAISVLLLVEPFVLVNQGKAVSCKVKDFHAMRLE